MRYLIDGYNLLFRIAKPNPTLEKKRDELIQELDQIISEFALKVSIVFDGANPAYLHTMRHHFNALEIIYTYEDMTADEYIIQEVSASPKQWVIITSDRSLSLQCIHLGAQTETIEAFLAFLKKKQDKKRRRQKEAYSERSFHDSDFHIARLLKIFEKKLLDDDAKEI